MIRMIRLAVSRLSHQECENGRTRSCAACEEGMVPVLYGSVLAYLIGQFLVLASLRKLSFFFPMLRVFEHHSNLQCYHVLPLMAATLEHGDRILNQWALRWHPLGLQMYPYNPIYIYHHISYMLKYTHSLSLSLYICILLFYVEYLRNLAHIHDIFVFIFFSFFFFYIYIYRFIIDLLFLGDRSWQVPLCRWTCWHLGDLLSLSEPLSATRPASHWVVQAGDSRKSVVGCHLVSLCEW